MPTLNRKQRRAGAQEPPMQLPPRQIIHPIAQAQLSDPDEDGSRGLVVHTLGPNTVQVFPLDAEQVKALGESALAPHVQTATPQDAAEIAHAAGGVVLGAS